MGAEQSKSRQQQGIQKTGLIKQMMNGFSGKKQFVPLQIPRITDLQYILNNRPNPVEINQQQSQKNNNSQIAKKILELSLPLTISFSPFILLYLYLMNYQ